MAATPTRPIAREETGRTTVDGDGTGGLLLELLGDADCRAILSSTGEEALSASEVSGACDLPLSTTYRKLDRLTEAGLLEEGLRLRLSGKHTSEYRRSVDAVHLSMQGDDGFELVLGRSDGSTGH